MARSDVALVAFRESNPVDESTLPGPESTEARTLFAEITSTPRTSPQTGGYTRRRLGLAIAIAILALALIAAAWLVFRDVSDPSSVGCYQATSLESDVVAASSGGALDASLCEPVWEEGTLVNEDIVPAGQIPPLVACVTEEGSLAVFPSDDTTICSQLGLARPAPESLPEEDVIRELDDDLVDYFAQQACQTVEQARQDIRQILDRYGLSDWSIQDSPGGPDRPCASYGLDAPSQTIHLVPVPQPD